LGENSLEFHKATQKHEDLMIFLHFY